MPLKTQEKGWFNDGISQFGARYAVRVDVDGDGAAAAAADGATVQWRAQSNPNLQTTSGRELTQRHLGVDFEGIFFSFSIGCCFIHTICLTAWGLK